MIHSPPGSFVPSPVALRALPGEGPSAPLRVATWALAAAATAGLHLALYLALTAREGAEPPPRPPETPAAVMVNLAPVPTAARSEIDNQAEGPPATATQEAAAPPEDVPPPIETVAPVPPLPQVANPQAVLPARPETPKVAKPEKPPETPVKEPKPRKEFKPRKEPERQATERPKKPMPRDKERVASRAGGGPRSDRQTADRTAAPSAGEAVSDATRASWQGEVRSRIVRAKRFPGEAHGLTGVAIVSVTITNAGGASGVRLVGSSGNAAFDAEAVAVIARAAPYPPPPGGRAATLTVPINFRR